MNHSHWQRVRTGVLVSALLTVFAFLASASMAVAAQDLNVSLGPGQTARIPLKLWCLEFGKPFPNAITGPMARASDPVVKALAAAVAKGTVTSDVYQTQLAVWRAADGTYHDSGTEGHAVAEQIITDSQNVQLSTIGANTRTLARVLAQGGLKVTIENFAPINDPAHFEGRPYAGTADLVVQNTSNQRISFVFLEGAVFMPTAGPAEQNLVAHQDSSRPATLPQQNLPSTGGSGPEGLSGLLTWIAAGLLFLSAGIRLARSTQVR